MVVANAYTFMPPRASCESVESSESAPFTLRSPIELANNDMDTAPLTPSTSGVKVENIPATASLQQDVLYLARPQQDVPYPTRPHPSIPPTLPPPPSHHLPPTPLPMHLNHPNATTYDTGILALSRLLHLRQTQTPQTLNNHLIHKQIQILKYLLLMNPRESSLTRYVERLADCRMLLQNQYQWSATDDQTQEGCGDFFTFNVNACKEIEDVMEKILQYLDGTHFHYWGVRKDMDPLTAVERLLRIREKICDDRVLEGTMKGLIEVKFREMAFLQQFQLGNIQENYRARLDAFRLQQPMRYGFTNMAVNHAWVNVQRASADFRQAASHPMQQAPKFNCAGPNCHACQCTSPSTRIPRTPLGNPFQGPGDPHVPVTASRFGLPHVRSEPQNPATTPYSPNSSYQSSISNLSHQPTLTPITPPFPPSPPTEPRLASTFPSETRNTPPSAPPSKPFKSREHLTEALQQIPDEAPRANQKKRRHWTESEIESQAPKAKVQRVSKK